MSDPTSTTQTTLISSLNIASTDPLVTVTMTKSQYDQMIELKARNDKTKEYHKLRRRIDRAKTEEEKEQLKTQIQQLNQKKK